jgi:cation transport regulator ChaC
VDFGGLLAGIYFGYLGSCMNDTYLNFTTDRCNQSATIVHSSRRAFWQRLTRKQTISGTNHRR